MLTILLLVGLVLGPLLLARLPRLPAAPGSVVVSPQAKVDLTVLVDGQPAELPTQRPLPANAGGATVTMAPTVQLATPEALLRIATALEDNPSIAVYPWRKTASRKEALATFFVLYEAMTMAPSAPPTGLVARRPDAPDDTPPKVYLGGHVVAERVAEGWAERDTQEQPLALVGAMVFFITVALCAVRFVADPSWSTLALYAAAVFSISLCLRQVGKFARLATILYPVTLGYWVVHALIAPFRRKA
ncbi:MAG TPA: hypothetical protein VHD87_01240 [Acidimicrobiales bacterium]|nr:hypothetical protein [Acidimicrobiales bacterium]